MIMKFIVPEPVKYPNKTRLAPTPSGYLHMGNILSFAITAYLAKKEDTKIFLRTDDIDRERTRKEYIADISETLNFLEIAWDKGPRNAEEFEETYSQRHRMPLYLDALRQLNDKGKVYACTCPRSSAEFCICQDVKIPLDAKGVCWRLIANPGEKLPVSGISGAINSIRALPKEMLNFIVRKKDGFPSYQLTSVVDDLFYGVDMIVRGEDLWASTIAQHKLALSLGKDDDFDNIGFYHHPLIKDASGEKLSKSAGATSIHYLRESGKSPEGIYSIIAEAFGIDKGVSNWQELGEAVVNRF